ncbi:uncharacterized protein [Paramisgurnus dabryanus]|uniref:uncharacterized protein n=1 Tax=Paramisgurnus dabryanus TaxID=90735 RepID=UPI0031F3CDAF
MTESNFDQVECERLISNLQQDIETLNNEYQTSTEISKRQQITETIEFKEQTLSELKGKLRAEQTLSELNSKLREDLTESQGTRRSVRPRNPTEKMLAFQNEEALKKERKLNSMYEYWKMLARKTRVQLKSDLTESQLATLIDTLEDEKDKVMRVYVDIRNHVTPSTELRRRVDACEAVTTDLIKVAYERISGIDEFDVEQVKHRLKDLLESSYARSIYGSTVSRISHKSSSQLSHHAASSCVASKHAEAAAELAAKEVEYKMLMEENKRKKKIQDLQEKQERDLDAQKRELEQLQAEKDLKVAQARFEAYNRITVQDVDHPSTNRVIMEQHCLPPSLSSQPANDISLSQTELPSLVQALQDSINLNRLPAPEPFVFNGDPIQYVEWKASFMSLIDRKSISAADKLYYLKRYVGGSAYKTLDGTFYRSDDEAYKDAWSKLDKRYGQPFVIQRAFRQKLADWPKIQSRDAIGLREFSDFLNACQEAIPHVASLQILNDCDENQRLVKKLPDWVASRWNRQVTQTLRDNKNFPDFKTFATFVSLEAEISCNPVTSSYALSLTSVNRQNLSEFKGNKANVFNTQTDLEHNRPNIIEKYVKPPCVFCQDSEHQLYDCSKLMTKTLAERRAYVKENHLCYGCLKTGHSARDCRHRHLCNLCKGKHPTCLHDDNFSKTERLASLTVSAPREEDDSTAVLSLSVAGKGSSYTSMVVPVWLSSANNMSTEKLVYALLDSQSDTTFIDQEVSNALQADKSPVKLKLTTMTEKDTIVKSERISGLRVRGYSSATYIDLPPVYTKDCIPVNHAHIPTCETAKRWTHFSAIVDEIPSLKDCEAGLLIGYNCARALAPRQTILGENDEPYAVKTDLGWSIVGPSLPKLDSSGITSLCHRLSVKEVPPLAPADAIRILEFDLKDANDDKPRSQDDIAFLNKLSDGIKENSSGHYEIALPFKARQNLPDNTKLALVRPNHQKRKLLKDQRYKEHCVKFMEEIIDRREAEEVKDGGNQGGNWYVPTKDNPVDHVSRGLTDEVPLSNKKIVLPANEITELQLSESEVRCSQILYAKAVEQETIVNHLSKFSSWSRVIGAIQRRIRKDKSKGLSTVEERGKAECFIIKLLQRHVFETEFNALSKGSQLSSYNQLYYLDPFLDSDCVLKVGERLSNSSLSLLKHLTIIPKDHYITEIIIADCHEGIKHQALTVST